MASKAPLRVVVTGAAGRVAYALLPLLAAGRALGEDQPVSLTLFDLPHQVKAMHGVRMELEDCAFPLLAGVTVTDVPAVAFRDARLALLLGARSRVAGMARVEVLAGNARIFSTIGTALGEQAADDCRVLVVANPCVTNAAVAMRAAAKAGRTAGPRFAAMMRLDLNRALARLARHAGCPVSAIRRLAIWGNHSPLVHADARFATAGGESLAPHAVALLEGAGSRGEAVRESLGAFAAASAARAAVGQVRDWWFGTGGEWTAMGVASDGAYGVPEGLVFGFPVTVEAGRWSIVRDLPLDEATRRAIDANARELAGELAAAESALRGLMA